MYIQDLEGNIFENNFPNLMILCFISRLRISALANLVVLITHLKFSDVIVRNFAQALYRSVLVLLCTDTLLHEKHVNEMRIQLFFQQCLDMYIAMLL